jgi:hypothetical protein
MYPILKNTDTGDSVRTGLDNSGNSVIKFMDFLEEEAAQADIEDLNLITDGTESGTQYYDNQELKFDPVAPATVLGTNNASSMFTFSELTSVSNYFSSVPYTSNKQVEQIGSGWSARTNDSLRDFIEANFVNESDPEYSLRKKLGPATPGIGGVVRELPYTDKVNTLLTQETFNNNEVAVRPGDETTESLTVEGYRNLLSGVEFWKYNLVMQCRDLEFKFRNTGLGNNGASKLTISGIVPKIPARTTTIPILNTVINLEEVPSREYVIYTELRGINLERWNVRVPYLLGLDNYNILEGVTGVPPGYRIEAGLGYKILGPGVNPEISSNINKSISLFDSAASRGFNLVLEFPDTPVLAPLNTSERLGTQIPELYNTYQEHPLIIFFNTNTNSNNNNKKFYNLLPVGITRYKVKLELANGEKVSRFFDTNWNPVTI